MANETFDQISHALAERNWYALAALWIGVAIYLWRKLAPNVWSKIPESYQWLPALLMGAATGFSGAYVAHQPLPVALLQALGGALWAGLPAIGGHHLLKDAPFLPYEGSVGTLHKLPAPPAIDESDKTPVEIPKGE